MAPSGTARNGGTSLSDQFISPYTVIREEIDTKNDLPYIYAERHVMSHNQVHTVGQISDPSTLALRYSPVSRPEIETYIKTLWKEEAQEALQVFTCESGLRPEAINWGDAKITGKPSMGIGQLNRPYDEKYFDWKYNLEESYALYLKRGWQPWTCAKKLNII